MSKKMKGVAFDSSPHVSYEDARARFKHQTLLQDYRELEQETEAARNKLEAMKQKKQTLEAEVRFLRRRHKFLLKSKSTTTSQQVKSHNLETTQFRKSKKENVHPKKAKTLHNLPPIHNLNQRGRVYTEKKNVNPGRPPHGDKNVNLHSVNMSPVTEFNRKENGFGGKEARVPIFDLNQISIEEEEEEHNDLKLSICRNVGDASSNRAGKRKISWQDPVALRV